MPTRPKARAEASRLQPQAESNPTRQSLRTKATERPEHSLPVSRVVLRLLGS